jgi:hypothetical protein
MELVKYGYFTVEYTFYDTLRRVKCCSYVAFPLPDVRKRNGEIIFTFLSKDLIVYPKTVIHHFLFDMLMVN